MIQVHAIRAKRHYLYILGLVLSSVLLGLNGFTGQAHAQAANSIYVTPASGTYTAGGTFTVSVRVNTTDPVNAAEAKMTYNSNLEFISIDGTGSAFGIDASSTGGGGSVNIARGTTGTVSGDQLVSKVTFKALSAGTGTITMGSGSQALSVASSTDVITVRNGGSYTINSSASSTPPPSTPPPAATPTAKTPSPTPSASKPTTTIQPKGSTTPTALPGDSTAELKTPATVETTPDPARKVTKVEYLLNGKVVSTDTTAPYNHSVETAKMRNGTYTLVTKTYYEDGKIDTSNASLIVKNPFGPTQAWLNFKHYAWLVILVLIIAGELIYLKFIKGRGKFSNPVMATAAPYHPNVVVGGMPANPSGPMVTPAPTVRPTVAEAPAPTPITSQTPPNPTDNTRPQPPAVQ